MGHQDFLLVVLTAVSPAWCPCLTFVHGCCHSYLQFSVMDVSVRTTMKGAAKCDKHCELQNSVNRQGLERILCFWDIPESMPASVSMLCCSSCCGSLWASFCECLCLRMCSGTLEAFDSQGSAATASLLSISCASGCAACGNCSPHAA